jgi:hypothetical protein
MTWWPMALFALTPLILFFAARRGGLLRLLSPNYAAVKVEGLFLARRRIVIRVRTPRIAAQWAGEPPKLNLSGLEGLAWLAEQGSAEASDCLFSRVLPARANYLEVESAVADVAELRSMLLDVIDGPAPT